MIQHLPETRGGPKFEWPEPLIIDLIHETYRHTVDPRDSIMLAKLQERTLRALFEGATLRSSALRLELTVCCAARGIDRKAIAMIDQAVFSELTMLVETCFRTCPRARVAIAKELHTVLGSIASSGNTAAKAPTAPRQGATSRRLH